MGPLTGRRVFVTRPRHQSGGIVDALEDMGAEPLAFPAIRIEPLDDHSELDAALRRLARGAYAWFVVTSANTVRVLADRFDALGLGPDVLRGVRVAAIGPATARELAALGREPDLVPDRFTTEAIAEVFPDPGEGSRRVLIPRAVEAPPELPEILSERGWEPEVVPAYRTVPDERSRDGGRAELDRGVDAVLFTSSSTVRAFLELWGPPPEGALVCCIGPVTADTAGEAGLRVDVVADEHTVAGLLAALADAVTR